MMNDTATNDTAMNDTGKSGSPGVRRAHPVKGTILGLALPALLGLALLGCQPTVRVEVPDKPITINLNIKIEQEIRIKIDKDVEDLLDKGDGLF